MHHCRELTCQAQKCNGLLKSPIYGFVRRKVAEMKVSKWTSSVLPILLLSPWERKTTRPTIAIDCHRVNVFKNVVVLFFAPKAETNGCVVTRKDRNGRSIYANGRAKAWSDGPDMIGSDSSQTDWNGSPWQRVPFIAISLQEGPVQHCITFDLWSWLFHSRTRLNASTHSTCHSVREDAEPHLFTIETNFITSSLRKDQYVIKHLLVYEWLQ